MELADFLENEKNNEMNLVKVEEGQLIIAEKFKNLLIDIETQKKEIEKQEKEMKLKLEEVMRENRIAGYESNDKKIKITLGEDGINETIDKDKLFKEYPQAYRECLKSSKRKGTLRVTIREVNNE